MNEVMRAPSSDIRATAAEAYIWGSPYVSAARLRLARTVPEEPFQKRIDTSPGAALNNIGRQRRLSDPRYRVGVGVNSDTLYTSAWLDLRDEPFVLEAPRIRDRYYSFQVAHADTSSDISIGSRSHGEQLPPVFLYGPHYQGTIPAGMLAISSHTRYMNLPGRILVNPEDAADFARVHEIQDRIQLRSWSSYEIDAVGPNAAPDQRVLDPPVNSDPRLRFFHELGVILQEEIFSKTDKAVIERLSCIGLTTTNGFSAKNLEPSVCDSMLEGLSTGQETVNRKARHLGTQNAGWTVNLNGPRFGDDVLLRAAVSRDQIFVTVPEEAMYFVAHCDSRDQPLRGEDEYELHFASDRLPPANAFWSITMYDNDGFLVSNKENIYALGDRSPGVIKPDGSVTIRIGLRPLPRPWLPAPSGPFYLMVRLFVPTDQVLTGKWLPPAIERIN